MDVFRLDILLGAAPLLVEGLTVTLAVSLTSFAFACALGLAVGVLRSRFKSARWIFAPYVELFRGTPLLIQLFFLYYGLPTVGIKMSAPTAAVLGLGLNGGAYISETIRGALRSIEQGQMDAARALGFTWVQAMVHVIVPQALRVALPPLVNSFSSLLKESSLVSVLAITELTRMSQLVYTRTFRAFEVYLAVGALYFVCTGVISWLSSWLERRFRVSGKIH